MRLANVIHRAITPGHSNPPIHGFYSIVWRSSEHSFLLRTFTHWFVLIDEIRRRVNNFSCHTLEQYMNSSESMSHSLELWRKKIPSINSRQEKCLIENGGLLEYFLLELIQIEHPDIRKRLFSKTITEKDSSDTSEQSNEQKSKLSKVIDEIEQCIYCLYGLVLRKSKMKYLNDHNCQSVTSVFPRRRMPFIRVF